MAEATVPAVSWEAPADGVLRIVLERPPANALGPPIVEGLNAALDVAEGDAGVKVIVVASRIVSQYETDGFFASTVTPKRAASFSSATRTCISPCPNSFISPEA